MKRPALIGGVVGGTFGAVFATFYALAAWLINTGRTETPGSWLPYFVTALVVWAIVGLLVAGAVMAAALLYKMTKVT